ncbi:MFS transporter [Gammaproteobacteria bacterium]|nr:MFS transporter [Gammaproteobacteria bacterium]
MPDIESFDWFFQAPLYLGFSRPQSIFFYVSFATSIVVFSLLGASVSGFESSSGAIVLGFGTQKERPHLIVILNTAAQLAGALGPFFGGLLPLGWDIKWYFLLESVFCLWQH